MHPAKESDAITRGLVQIAEEHAARGLGWEDVCAKYKFKDWVWRDIVRDAVLGKHKLQAVQTGETARGGVPGARQE